MNENMLSKLPNFLTNIVTLNLVIFILLGATPSVNVPTMISFVGIIFLVFLVFFGKRRARVGLLGYELFLLTFVCYASIVTLINDPNILLFLRNGAFLLILPLFIWVKSSKFHLSGRLNFDVMLPLLQLVTIVKMIIFERPQLQGFRLFLDDYNIADSAVIFMFCLGLISGQLFSRILSFVLFIMVLGFGIRLNSLIMFSFLTLWMASSRKGRAVLLSFSIFGLFLAPSLNLNNLFVVEKFLKYGSSYKVNEISLLFSQLDFSTFLFPHGLSHGFVLGVFGDSVYFSHFFVLYMLTCLGFVGLIFIVYIVYLLIVSSYLAIKTKEPQMRWMILSISASLIPALTLQASYKSLTFFGLVYALACIVSPGTFDGRKHRFA